MANKCGFPNNQMKVVYRKPKTRDPAKRLSLRRWRKCGTSYYCRVPLSNLPNDFPLQMNRSELPNTQVQSINLPFMPTEIPNTTQTWSENIPHKNGQP
jgi:hypothetical protein